MSASIPRFMLADLTAEELSREMVRIAQASTPEWKNVRDGDPGKAIIDAVAWMGSTILYRVNLLPRRQRLEFLRLLGLKLRAAEPARGIVALGHKRPQGARPTFAPEGTRLPGPVTVETRSPVTVQPFEGKVVYKRRLEGPEVEALRDVIDDLAELYGIDAADPYATTALFEDGRAVAEGIDPFAASVDRSCWIALLALADTDAAREAAREAFDAQPALLNIGIIPRIDQPEPDPDAPEPAPIRHVEWSMTTRRPPGTAAEDGAIVLQVEDDRTAQLSREATLRLVLPGAAMLPDPTGEDDIDAGLGESPPRLDDPADAARLIGWVRVRALDANGTLPLSWLGINASMVDARETRRQIQVGVAVGRPAQTVTLPARDIDPDSFVLSVQEGARGFVRWYPTEDIGAAGRHDRAFTLDAAAGTVTFGDGLTGSMPERGARIRADYMRSGGGVEGNLAPGTLGAVEQQGLKALQPSALTGGRVAETLEQAEKRVTAWLQHNDRCVTAADYRALAADLGLARVEVLPRLRPYQIATESPGVVSVLPLPFKGVVQAPNPRPDRRLIERVRAHLEPRRPLGTELFVIAPDYVKIGVAVACDIREGFAREAVVRALRAALLQFLWPLAGGGRDGVGWPLGQSVLSLEVDLIAARVEGVLTTAGASVFTHGTTGYALVPKDPVTGAQVLKLDPWQLPECLDVEIAVGATATPTSMVASGGGGTGSGGTAVPVVPEVC